MKDIFFKIKNLLKSNWNFINSIQFLNFEGFKRHFLRSQQIQNYLFSFLIKKKIIPTPKRVDLIKISCLPVPNSLLVFKAGIFTPNSHWISTLYPCRSPSRIYIWNQYINEVLSLGERLFMSYLVVSRLKVKNALGNRVQLFFTLHTNCFRHFIKIENS